MAKKATPKAGTEGHSVKSSIDYVKIVKVAGALLFGGGGVASHFITQANMQAAQVAAMAHNDSLSAMADDVHAKKMDTIIFLLKQWEAE